MHRSFILSHRVPPNPFLRFDLSPSFSLTLSSSFLRFVGLNSFAQFSNFLRSFSYTSFILPIHSFHPFAVFASGASSFLLGDGLYSCGRNLHGILGLGHKHMVTYFQKVQIPSIVCMFAVHERNAIALDIHSNIFTWGYQSVLMMKILSKTLVLLPF